MTPQIRPHYVDGQRLEAADLRAEQDHHIGVRRVLNHALFGEGIAGGLDVAVTPGDPRIVVVSPGVALDEFGREIVLVEPREVPVAGVPSTQAGTVHGNYLVIGYAERRTATTVAPDVALAWQQTWPRTGSGLVVLAQAELAADCSVARLVRRADQGTATVPVTMCGVRDLDAASPIDLHFTIRRARPQRAVLMLQAEEFSTLHYTELGGHVHGIELPFERPSTSMSHRHDIPDGETEAPEDRPTHQHNLRIEYGADAEGVNEHNPEKIEWSATFTTASGSVRSLVYPGGRHRHRFAATNTLPGLEQEWQHDHPAPNARMLDAGATDIAAGSAARHGYVSDLQVDLDGSSSTGPILDRLRSRDGDAWMTLGDGSASHRLVTAGTAELDLLDLGVQLEIDTAHRLTLRVAAGGGRVRYHLYLE